MAFETRLNLSCETFALLKTPYFISSFPSYILFGKTEINEHYSEGSVFKINFSDAYKLLVNILYICSFLGSDLDSSKGLISKNDHEQYCWSAYTDPKGDKLIKFEIQKNSELTFEIIFNVTEYNNFLYLFQRCLLSCLCLKEVEEEFITFVIENEECHDIFEARSNVQKCKKMIVDFFKTTENSKKYSHSSLIEKLKYYNDVILIMKQLFSIRVPEENHASLILANC